ncbi:hypothetical protein MCOR27_001892 [Pyricularia oryzae]|nr:hypothetical protein MCOR01_001171 [Pyricularia oryzae]KAI6286295.1 hypothetical protein MCOR27_001892 [Pyricularia oryzae]KAI6349433.1 hypothetical protein MCOR28_001043 [Pyricularia oryzae]KAI6402981.1 hypothetical protein MCOR23_003713 [Pyricularia oryzae]KAI6415418.1 hypothetical protein MCOR20_001595 [Pyricularia oryzae]
MYGVDSAIRKQVFKYLAALIHLLLSQPIIQHDLVMYKEKAKDFKKSKTNDPAEARTQDLERTLQGETCDVKLT